MKKTILFCSALILAGCSTGLTPEQIAQQEAERKAEREANLEFFADCKNVQEIADTGNIFGVNSQVFFKLEKGNCYVFSEFEVLQVLDLNNYLIRFYTFDNGYEKGGRKTALLNTGFKTLDFVNGQRVNKQVSVKYVGNYTYSTAFGSTNTVRKFELLNSKKGIDFKKVN